MKLPEILSYYTADEIAETIEFADDENRSLYSKLWSFLDAAENPTPIGGDGSNGTVECRGDRMSLDNDDKAVHFWDKLTEAEQKAIVAGYLAEYPDETEVLCTECGKSIGYSSCEITATSMALCEPCNDQD